MNLAPLSRLVLEPLVRAALIEDIGLAGDITTNAIVPPEAETRARSSRASRASSRALIWRNSASNLLIRR